MKLKLIIIVLSIIVAREHISFKDRFLVPIYIKYGISAGYGDNLFKFSDTEKENFSTYSYMGSASTYDSAIIKPEVKFIYSPYLGKKLTNFIFYTNSTDYTNIDDKDSQYYSVRFDYKIGAYNWIKMGYKYSDNNFLRYYIDNDTPGENYVKCDYRSENFYANYSINLDSYGWSRIQVGQTKHFFNPNFTEFDLNISEIVFNHYYKYKNNTIHLMLSNKKANNISYNDGLNSTLFDRSYKQNDFKISIKKKTDIFLKSLTSGFQLIKRDYLSESELDPIHSGRSHSEYYFFISALKELRYDMHIELKYNFRYRKTNSSFDWVEPLKSFQDNQILLKFTYDMDVDLFY